EVKAISSGTAPISFAIEARTRLGRSKNAMSGSWCGAFFHSIAFCKALIAAFGTGLCPAKFKYVAPSNSCHSFRQSTIVLVAVAMAHAPSALIILSLVCWAMQARANLGFWLNRDLLRGMSLRWEALRFGKLDKRKQSLIDRHRNI